jgi:hypothetical protein
MRHRRLSKPTFLYTEPRSCFGRFEKNFFKSSKQNFYRGRFEWWKTEEKNLMHVSLYLISGQRHVSNQLADAQESAQYHAWPGKWTPLATLKKRV